MTYGAPNVYEPYATFDDILRVMGINSEEDGRYYTIRLYGRTLNKFAAEIGELMFGHPAHFTEEDLYEFYEDTMLDEYGVINLSGLARAEKKVGGITRIKRQEV